MLAELQPLTEMLDAAFEKAQELLKGLNQQQLNWRPIEGATREEMTSSLYGLALHLSFVALNGANRIIGRAPDIYPEAEQGNNGIQAHGESAARALQVLVEAQTRVREVAEALTSSQLEEIRERRFGNWVAEPKTVRWMMWHILEHMMLHIGHMELTRQLVLQAKASAPMPQA